MLALIRTVPGMAAACIRAATFVVSPIAVYSVLISPPIAAARRARC